MLNRCDETGIDDDGVTGLRTDWPAATAADPEKKIQSTQMISTRELRGGGIDGMNFNCVQT